MNVTKSVTTSLASAQYVPLDAAALPLKWPHTPTSSSTVGLQPFPPRNCLQQPHTDSADPLGQARALPPGSFLQRCKFLLFVSLFHRVLECGHFKWLDPELWAAERRKARGPGYGAPPDLSWTTRRALASRSTPRSRMQPTIPIPSPSHPQLYPPDVV
ncbi:hypothetical protein R3P38DRAFT_3285823 [Favolaschia claudopus]|uniref:Uncharacterized protein n=1 Tax=Favolaschia claudopus TaxID=2862362 RepID=A0AAW0A244_9AGAR